MKRAPRTRSAVRDASRRGKGAESLLVEKRTPVSDELPARGRIVMVNFDLGGGTALHAELAGPAQPCLVLRVDGREQPPLVTVVPLSALRPDEGVDDVHQCELASFKGWPAPLLFRSLPRWARCGHLATISADRCSDPAYTPPGGRCLRAAVRATPADVAAVEAGVLRALGIAPPAAKKKAPQG